MKFLEVGTSKIRGKNWQFIDMKPHPQGITHDMRKPLDFINDNTYDGIYTEHFIEHVEKNEGINVFKEFLRILKPNGKLRVVWPKMEIVDYFRSEKDLSKDKLVKLYSHQALVESKWAPPGCEHMRIQDQCAEAMLFQNGEHKYLWYVNEMIDTLKELGYNNVFEEKYRYSSYKPFNNIDIRCRSRFLHSGVVEATK